VFWMEIKKYNRQLLCHPQKKFHQRTSRSQGRHSNGRNEISPILRLSKHPRKRIVATTGKLELAEPALFCRVQRVALRAKAKHIQQPKVCLLLVGVRRLGAGQKKSQHSPKDFQKNPFESHHTQVAICRIVSPRLFLKERTDTVRTTVRSHSLWVEEKVERKAGNTQENLSLRQQ